MTTVLIIVGIWLAFNLVAVIIMAFAYRRGYKHGALDGFHEGFLAATNHVLEDRSIHRGPAPSGETVRQ